MISQDILYHIGRTPKAESHGASAYCLFVTFSLPRL